MQTKDTFAIPVLIDYLRASFRQRNPDIRVLSAQQHAAEELLKIRSSWLRRLPKDSAVRQRMLKVMDAFILEHLPVHRIRNPFLRIAMKDQSSGLEELAKTVDMSQYHKINEGAQAVVYRGPQGDVIKLFKGLEKEKESVERYAQIVNGLPQELYGIKVPRVRVVRATGVPKTRFSHYGIQTDFADGKTVWELWIDLEAWTSRVSDRNRISRFLDEVDRLTDGLADRHWETGDDLAFDLESTSSNFMIPKKFLIEEEKEHTGLTPKSLEQPDQIEVICIDPINIVELERRLLQEKAPPPAGSSDSIEEESTGLEEAAGAMERVGRWLGEHRQAGLTSSRVVLGASVAQALPLQILAGLEERLVVDRGDVRRAVVDLVAQDARSAVFYGGLEEFQEFKPLAVAAGIAPSLRSVDHPGVRDELAQLILRVLLDLGYSPEVVSAGLEELTHDLILLGEEA
jgi:hypothetical protein